MGNIKFQMHAVVAFAAFSIGMCGYAAESANKVLSSYQAAHQAKNIDAVTRLVHFRTQDLARRASWLKDLAATFSSTIASIKLVPFGEYAFMLPEAERKKLPVTLKPVNWLTVEFMPKQSDAGRTESMNYLVGVENGKYFIIGP